MNFIDYLIHLAFSYVVFNVATMIYIFFTSFAGISYEWFAKFRLMGKVPTLLIVIFYPIATIMHWSVWTSSYVELTMSRMQSSENVSPWIWWILTFVICQWTVLDAAAYTHDENPKCLHRHAWLYLPINIVVFFTSIHFSSIIRWIAPSYYDGIMGYIEFTIP
jgi:hypothetical protein